jgi:hypothetical protein
VRSDGWVADLLETRGSTALTHQVLARYEHWVDSRDGQRTTALMRAGAGRALALAGALFGRARHAESRRPRLAASDEGLPIGPRELDSRGLLCPSSTENAQASG